jgi:NitT/TauT family transport system substrate-binding protein
VRQSGVWQSFVARLVTGLVLVALAACSPAAASPPGTSSPDLVRLRLGMFPNVTHASALVGVETGILADAVGRGVELDVASFTAGPQAVEALFAGALDATFMGPNPAINAYVQSRGDAVRIVSGATSGGAFLVVRDGVDSVDDLRGATLATPQLGGTQDVALRAWLDDQGIDTDPDGGGEVSIVPQANAQTLDAFQSGAVDGAWLPEPWATRLVDAGAHVLVDERDLWPSGEYVTTHLVVRTEYLEDHPDVVTRLLRGHVDATAFVNEHPAAAQRLANDAIESATGTRIHDDVLAQAWGHLSFTVDPLVTSLQEVADDAAAVGFLDPSDLSGIYDLHLLQAVLRERGAEPLVLP